MPRSQHAYKLLMSSQPYSHASLLVTLKILLRHLPSFLYRNRRVLLRLAIFLIIFWPCFLYLLLAYVLPTHPGLFPVTLLNAKSPLLVVAHPDDECLFFSPAILHLTEKPVQSTANLLVLSTGNNYGIGAARQKELQESCKRLGIQEKRCVVLQRDEIQDDPKKWWPENVVSEIVESYVRRWNVDAIVTFDRGGTSGHINHRAVSAAVRAFAESDPEAPPIYLVTTTMLLRKYTLLADLPLTSLRFTFRILAALSPFSSVSAQKAEAYANRGLIVNNWVQYQRGVWAFWAHESQRVWDRNLYVVLSRYMWFNDVVRVEPKS